jgi:hypothetical protein
VRLFARPRAEERAFARNLVLWFLVASPFLWIVGRFASRLIGGLLMPVSSFWLILVPGPLLLGEPEPGRRLGRR